MSRSTLRAAWPTRLRSGPWPGRRRIVGATRWTLQFAPLWVLSALAGTYTRFDPYELDAFWDVLVEVTLRTPEPARSILASTTENRAGLLADFEPVRTAAARCCGSPPRWPARVDRSAAGSPPTTSRSCCWSPRCWTSNRSPTTCWSNRRPGRHGGDRDGGALRRPPVAGRPRGRPVDAGSGCAVRSWTARRPPRRAPRPCR